MRKMQPKGFSVIELVVILAVVGAFALIGYRVLGRNSTSKDSSKSTTQKISTVAQETPSISTKQDLQKAADQLKGVDASTQKEESELQQLIQ